MEVGIDVGNLDSTLLISDNKDVSLWSCRGTGAVCTMKPPLAKDFNPWSLSNQSDIVSSVYVLILLPPRVVAGVVLQSPMQGVPALLNAN